MGLTNRGILYVVELVYWVPALFLSAYIVKKHGLGRQLGWIYLCILGLLRLIGASTGIAAIYNPSTGLIECSLITFTVGISPLLLALHGILRRVNEGMKGRGIPQRLFLIANLPILVGLILAIIAGTKEFDSNPSTRSTGYTFGKIGIMLLFVGFLVLVALAVMTFTKRSHILEGEQRLAIAALISLPFIAIRIVYSIIAVFDHTSSVFSVISTKNSAVIVQSLMSVLMEFIVVAIYIAAGLLVRVIPRSMVKEGYVDPPSYKTSTAQPVYTGVQSRDGSPSYPLTAQTQEPSTAGYPNQPYRCASNV